MRTVICFLLLYILREYKYIGKEKNKLRHITDNLEHFSYESEEDFL